MKSRSIYNVGPPASECKSGPSLRYSALCSTKEKPLSDTQEVQEEMNAKRAMEKAIRADEKAAAKQEKSEAKLKEKFGDAYDINNLPDDVVVVKRDKKSKSDKTITIASTDANAESFSSSANAEKPKTETNQANAYADAYVDAYGDVYAEADTGAKSNKFRL